MNDFTDLNIFVGKNNSGKIFFMEAMVLSEICGNVEQLLATLISRYPKLNIDRIGTMFDVNDARRQIVLEHSLCDERIENIYRFIRMLSAQKQPSIYSGRKYMGYQQYGKKEICRNACKNW